MNEITTKIFEIAVKMNKISPGKKGVCKHWKYMQRDRESFYV